MTKADRQVIAELLENQKKMEARLRELEAQSTTSLSPPYQGGESSEATDDDLIYILRTKGREEYHEALKTRNRQRAMRWGLDKRLRRAA